MRDFARGFEAGFFYGRQEGSENTTAKAREYLFPVLGNLMILNMIGGKIMGIALAGFGNLTQEQMKPLAAELAKAVKEVESGISQATKVYDGIESDFDITGAYTLLDLANHFVTTKDEKPLLDFTSTRHHMIADIVNLRLTHGPGAPRDKVIDRLCDRAKPLRDSGMEWNEIVDQLMHDLFNAKEHARQEEFKRLSDWSDPANSLAKHYRDHYPDDT